MQRVTAAMCCAIPILFAGSSTIVKGTEQQVSVNTPGGLGALCQLHSPAIGTRTAQRPANITMLKSKKIVAGLGVDAAPGAMNTYDPGVEVVMTPLPGCVRPPRKGMGVLMASTPVPKATPRV